MRNFEVSFRDLAADALRMGVKTRLSWNHSIHRCLQSLCTQTRISLKMGLLAGLCSTHSMLNC